MVKVIYLYPEKNREKYAWRNAVNMTLPTIAAKYPASTIYPAAWRKLGSVKIVSVGTPVYADKIATCPN